MKSSFFKNLSILILGVCLVLVKTDTSEAIYEEKYSQIIGKAKFMKFSLMASYHLEVFNIYLFSMKI